MKAVDIVFLPDPVKSLFEKTKRVAISCEASSESLKKDNVFISKIGGSPYFPKGMDYPKNEKGNPLALAAQINLDDLFADPKMADNIEKDSHLKLLPRKGMMSFFYNAMDDDYLMGLDFEDKGKVGCKVLYFPEIVDDLSQLTDEHYQTYKMLIQQGECEHLGFSEIDEIYSLQFLLKETLYPIYTGALTFNNLWLATLNEWVEALDYDKDEVVIDQISEYISGVNAGHAIGGYPYLAQSDPRSDASDQAIMLFQIDSVGDIMIGDAGSMQFFISEDDLQNLDFSNVLYDWACG